MYDEAVGSEFRGPKVNLQKCQNMFGETVIMNLPVFLLKYDLISMKDTYIKRENIKKLLQNVWHLCTRK